MLENYPELLRKSEIAKILRISKLTVYRMARAGKLKFIRINKRGDRRFYKKDILEMLGE